MHTKIVFDCKSTPRGDSIQYYCTQIDPPSLEGIQTKKVFHSKKNTQEVTLHTTSAHK